MLRDWRHMSNYHSLPLPSVSLRCLKSQISDTLDLSWSTMTYSRSAGWWLSHPSEKYEFVSWDHDIPNIWKVIKTMFQTTNQFVILVIKKKKNEFHGSTPWPPWDLGKNHNSLRRKPRAWAGRREVKGHSVRSTNHGRHLIERQEHRIRNKSWFYDAQNP